MTLFPWSNLNNFKIVVILVKLNHYFQFYIVWYWIQTDFRKVKCRFWLQNRYLLAINTCLINSVSSKLIITFKFSKMKMIICFWFLNDKIQSFFSQKTDIQIKARLIIDFFIIFSIAKFLFSSIPVNYLKFRNIIIFNRRMLKKNSKLTILRF